MYCIRYFLEIASKWSRCLASLQPFSAIIWSHSSSSDDNDADVSLLFSLLDHLSAELVWKAGSASERSNNIFIRINEFIGNIRLLALLYFTWEVYFYLFLFTIIIHVINCLTKPPWPIIRQKYHLGSPDEMVLVQCYYLSICRWTQMIICHCFTMRQLKIESEPPRFLVVSPFAWNRTQVP